MKTKDFSFILLVVLSIFLLSQSFSGIQSGIHENIALALKTGNSKALAGYFATTVEVTLPGKEGTFSKTQAEMVMKDFFSKNPPKGFTIDQRGTSAGGAQFIIGTYQSNNKSYKAYLLLKTIDKQLLIQQIQFE